MTCEEIYKSFIKGNVRYLPKFLNTAKKFEFLGQVQPIRLIDNLWKNITKRPYTAEAKELNKIISVKKIGVQNVVALETSSHTYFANGYAAHNSVAEHCVRMSYADIPGCPKWRLMHDAAEAYISDVPSPVKPMLIEFKGIENKILDVIKSKFNLGVPDHDAIRYADLVMLATEKRDVLNTPCEWGIKLPEPLAIIIQPLPPIVAEKLFLNQAKELGII
jgi:hypothetical protein